MGDMKTPDFDDLLAAFDIPDMVDPKAAIESGPPEDHGGLKQASGGVTTIEDDGHTHSSGQDVGVSVIVKNTRSIDTLIDTNIEPFGSLSGNDDPVNSCAHPHVAIDNGLQNGCLSAIYSSNQHNKNGWKSCREQGLVNQKTSAFNQFSPISSAEEFDDDDVDDKIDVDDPMDKKSSQSSLRTSQKPLTGNTSCPSREELNQKQSASVEICGANTRPSREGQSKSDQNNKSSYMSAAKPSHISKSRKSEEQVKPQGMGKQDRESPGDGIVSGSSLSQAKAKSSAKLSFCIAAIAALSAKKACSTDTIVSDCPVVQNESIPVSSRKESPKKKKESVPEKSNEPQESALEVAKRLSSRQPDSPSSVTSEGSSKGSSGSPTGTTPAVPKVRIKTIKTSSGQIKRTVTRVIPEIDTEVLKKGERASLPTVMVSSIISLATSNAILSSPKSVAATTGLPSLEKNKQMTIKPVATAFLPVSAVKTACSQVINLKLANNTTVKATVIPAASVQSASNAILKAANAIQQQTVMVPSSSLSNAKPKTVHFTNLNLLPQAVYSATCELQQALCTSKQSQHQQLPQQVKQKAVHVGQVPKKASRIQMFGNSQSSVVDAFNKVLSSINPVPVYVPNLSPPTSACISLPSRGYKCLECGDSFALEKSLTHHYERRSVRIEVTCNHCAKNLVFYNKCSLLSHARGHKDRGMVMQCSHLILKPIPADQMTTATPSTCVTSASTTQTQNSTAQTPEKAPVSGTQTAVIGPCGAPIVAAMHLDDNATKISRNSLKCLECNEMFLNDSSLAMHYQQTPESNGQKTCTICQMLLPNQCSFASHQRIHQHKSPYICPECGASCRSVHFQSHVTKNCLHYTRRVGYRCVHCSLIFADIAALKSHIQGSHCETFYKCSVCPMAFKSAPGTHSHAYTQHPGVKIGEPKLIYKCSMCDTVFTLQSLLHTHFDQHIVSHTVSVFKCPDCSMHYAHKQLMLDHITESHGTLKTIEGPPNLGISLPLTSKPTNSNSSNRDGGNLKSKDKKPPLQPLRKTNSNCSAAVQKVTGPDYTCRDCESQLPSREGYVAHMRREHGQILKKHPCRQCEKSFSSSHSLCRHNRLKHKGLRKVYTCPRCPARSPPFTKRILLDQHIQLMHGLKDEDMKTVDDDNMESTPDKTHSQIPSPKRKTDDDEKSPGLGSDSQPLKKLKVNVLKVHRCAVCGFTNEDMAAFHGHIPQHKSDGSSFQCQSCGLCYTSHRSLARHRFIVHRLREPQDLARRNARGDDDDESQRENQLGALDEDDDGKPSTKCKVCGKVFDTEGHLNTHMRTHGMAFIKSKRLSSGDK